MDPVLTVLSNISFSPVLGLVISIGLAIIGVTFALYAVRLGANFSGAMKDSFDREENDRQELADMDEETAKGVRRDLHKAHPTEDLDDDEDEDD
jgi:hypothetical protein